MATKKTTTSELSQLKKKLTAMEKHLMEAAVFTWPVGLDDFYKPVITSRNTVTLGNTFQVNILGEHFSRNTLVVFSAYMLYWKTGQVTPITITNITTDGQGKFNKVNAISFVIDTDKDWAFKWVFIDATDTKTGKRATMDVRLPSYFDNGLGG